MSSEPNQPATPGPDATTKTWLNAAAAGLFALLAGWMTAADFAHRGDPLFQSSASFGLAFFFLFLLSVLAVVLAVFPKRMILGINLLFLSRLAYGYPFSVTMSSQHAVRLVSLLMLGLALVYLGLSLKRALRMNSRPWVRWRHSLAMLAMLVVLGIAGVPFLILGLERGARDLIGDYTKFTLDGVTLKERVFRKGRQEVHLVGMMHIGDGSYYQELSRRMNTPPADGGRRLVLTEGVSDKHGVLPPAFASGDSYARLASALGVETQQPLGPSAEPGAPDAGSSADGSVTWKNADIDVSELEGRHRELLVTLLGALADGPSSALFRPELGEIDGPQLEEMFKEGLILSRNDVLMESFDELGAGFTQIYIPWGAAHLPDIEQRLVARGYQLVDEIPRSIMTFWE